MYLEVLQEEPDHSVAFSLAKLYAKHQDYEKALQFFTMALDKAQENLLYVEPM